MDFCKLYYYVAEQNLEAIVMFEHVYEILKPSSTSEKTKYYYL